MADIDPVLPDFSFEPRAMLPAWLVTDENWIVRNCNRLAEQLVAGLCPLSIADLKSGKVTLAEVYPQDDHVSLWGCLLELDKTQQQLIKIATDVMAEHVEILGRYREPSEHFDMSALIAELRRVQGVPGVYPYVFDRREKEEYLRIGIRIAPRGGLQLRAEVSLAEVDPEDSDPRVAPRPMTHIEIALGYRVRVRIDNSRPNRPRITVAFLGSQPAIHDSTGRSLLERELEDLRITSNITHALKTPLSNAFSAARRIHNPGTHADEAQRLSGRLLAQISEADALVRLLLLVNAHETLPVTARAGTDPMWPTIAPDTIRYQLAQALMSVFHMRTERGRDLLAIKTLLETHGLGAPDERNKNEVEAIFRQLADMIFSGDTTSFFLTASIQSPRFTSLEAAELAKTVALQLILTELIINAVKHGDSGNPQITFHYLQTSTGVLWTVENTVLTTGVPSSQQHSAGPLSGARRGALGNYLNQKATDILAWKLDRLPPRSGWEAHRLFIPLESREPL